MQQVLVHNSSLDDVFFVSKFLHKPRTVDVALSLGLLQADVLEAQGKSYSRWSNRDFNKYPMKHAPNPQPGVLGTPTIEDNKAKWEEKLATLRAQRRAHGLCMKSGEKWGRNHKCPEKISLQVLEEFMEILPKDPPSDHSSAVSSDDEQVFALS